MDSRKVICTFNDGTTKEMFFVKNMITKNNCYVQVKDENGRTFIFEEKNTEPIDEIDDIFAKFVKETMVPNMTISVKDNEMNLFKKCLVIAGFEPYSDMKYGGTFYLDVDGQHVLNNAASKKDVPFDTILNRIRNCGAKRIEPWMVNEINEMLRKENSILTLEWEYTESSKDLQEENRNILCNIRLVETKYVDTYIVNPTKEFYTMIENYFAEKGLTRINYNNTKSTFWNLDGYSKRDFYYEKKN